MALKLVCRSLFFQTKRIHPNKFSSSKVNRIEAMKPTIESLLCRSVNSPLTLCIGKRFYALKLYSQYYPEREVFGNNILRYIKLTNDLNINSDIYNISNVFDDENAIKQLHSIILHSIEVNPDNIIKLFLLYVSCKRSILHQTHILKESSRILQYKIESAVFYMNFDQLYQLSVSLKELHHHRIKFFKMLGNLLFEETLSRIQESDSIHNIIKHFLIGFELFGNGIKNKRTYMEYISLFGKHLNNANPIQLTQILYFTGLAKNKNIIPDLLQPSVRLLSSNFEEISFVDAGLAISSLFKMNFRIESNVPLLSQIGDKITEFVDIVSDNYVLSPLESFAIVAMVKYLRLSQYKDPKVLNVMKVFISKLDSNSLNPQFISHIVALFANNSYYDADLYSLVEIKFNEFIESNNEVLRIKDISRLMWSLSYTQHQCKDETLSLVNGILENFCKTGDISLHPTHVIDSAIALSTYGKFPLNIMRDILNPNIYEIVRGANRGRHLSRFVVLREIQKLSFPSFQVSLPKIDPKELPQRSISEEVFYRPCIKYIQNAIHWLQKECGMPIFTLEFLIPCINYCSVVLAVSSKSLGAHIDQFPKQFNSIENGSSDENTTEGYGEFSPLKKPVLENGSSDENIIEGYEEFSPLRKQVLDKLLTLNNYRISIEVDDENTSLNGRTRTNGIEVLKRRLIQMKGYDVKTVAAKDIEACEDDEQALAALLLQKIHS